MIGGVLMDNSKKGEKQNLTTCIIEMLNIAQKLKLKYIAIPELTNVYPNLSFK